MIFTSLILASVSYAMMSSRHKSYTKIPGCRTTDGCCKKARVNAGLERLSVVITSFVISKPSLQVATYGCRDSRKKIDVPSREILSDGPYILECPSPYVLVHLIDVMVGDSKSSRNNEAFEKAYCVLAGDIFTSPDKYIDRTHKPGYVYTEVTFYNELLLAWITTDKDITGKLGHASAAIRAPYVWISMLDPEHWYWSKLHKFANISSVVMRNPPGKHHVSWDGEIHRDNKKFENEVRLHLAVVDIGDEEYY